MIISRYLTGGVQTCQFSNGREKTVEKRVTWPISVLVPALKLLGRTQTFERNHQLVCRLKYLMVRVVLINHRLPNKPGPHNSPFIVKHN